MSKPTLAVWKFASCDGCQMSLLDCEDELLALAQKIQIASFPEASSAVLPGPYDISLVEGSITTPEDERRIHAIREQSGLLVALGACATSGGIQALRNLADIEDFTAEVYAHPQFIDTLATSTPASAHVRVDLELRGCPIDRHQLLETVGALLAGRAPALDTAAVCTECKRRGTSCVMVADGIACLGPVTQAGCGALCPAYHRGCFGCFGPMATPNVEALAPLLRRKGMSELDVSRVFSTFNVGAPAFAAAAQRATAAAATTATPAAASPTMEVAR